LRTLCDYVMRGEYSAKVGICKQVFLGAERTLAARNYELA